jgi:hypothetical protein
MGFTVERNNIIGFGPLVRSLITDLLANGFTEANGATITESTTQAVLVAGLTVDPLSATQPWRIRLGCGATQNMVQVHAGTQTNINNDGTIYTTGIGQQILEDTVGQLRRGVAADSAIQGEGRYVLWNNAIYDGGGLLTIPPQSKPFAYRLSITPRGIAVVAWVEGYDSDGDEFFWFVIQRPVDNNTGTVLTTGRCPVFAVWGVGTQSTTALNPNNSEIWRFTVREIDVDVPTPPKRATVHTPDAHAVINPSKQVAIAEGNQFVIKFPHGFNTQRYMYKHEVDMLAYTSADVISQWSETDVTVYGEAQQRTYKAMNANGPNNTGMRILILIENGGI